MLSTSTLSPPIRREMEARSVEVVTILTLASAGSGTATQGRVNARPKIVSQRIPLNLFFIEDVLSWQKTSEKFFFCGLPPLFPPPLGGGGRVGVNTPLSPLSPLLRGVGGVLEGRNHPPPSPSPQGRGKFRGILKLLQRPHLIMYPLVSCLKKDAACGHLY